MSLKTKIREHLVLSLPTLSQTPSSYVDITLSYQNLLVCRVPMNSILGFIMRTYKKVGYGSVRYTYKQHKPYRHRVPEQKHAFLPVQPQWTPLPPPKSKHQGSESRWSHRRV